MRHPQAILFDLGETLVHFAGLDRTDLFRQGARAGQQYLVARGYRLPGEDEFVQSLLWRGRKAMLLNRLSRRELDVAELAGLAIRRLRGQISPDDWRQFILRMYEPLAQASTLDPHARDVIDRLRAAGLKVGLISNTFIPPYAIDHHLARLGLLDLFDERLYSAEIGLKKPSLSLFRRAVAALRVPPAAAWHVGDDLLADVLGARRAGLTAVLRLPPGRRVRGWWLVKPHLAIHSLLDLLLLVGL